MVLYTEISDQTFLYIFSSRFWTIKSFKTLNFLHGLLPGSSGKKKLPLNLATSNNASLTSRGHWSLEHVPSQRIIHRLIKFVAFALAPVS